MGAHVVSPTGFSGTRILYSSPWFLVLSNNGQHIWSHYNGLDFVLSDFPAVTHFICTLTLWGKVGLSLSPLLQMRELRHRLRNWLKITHQEVGDISLPPEAVWLASSALTTMRRSTDIAPSWLCPPREAWRSAHACQGLNCGFPACRTSRGFATGSPGFLQSGEPGSTSILSSS